VKKGIYLQAKLDVGEAKEPDAVKSLLDGLPGAFEEANPGMQLTVKKHSAPDEQGKTTVEVYIQGEQAPASSFFKLASRALKKGVTTLSKREAKRARAGKKGAAQISLGEIYERENEDEDEGVILPPANNS